MINIGHVGINLYFYDLDSHYNFRIIKKIYKRIMIVIFNYISKLSLICSSDCDHIYAVKGFVIE